MNTRRQKGFSLVEALLSSAIFGLAVMSLIGVMAYAQEGAYSAGSRSRAVLLADETLEATRNIRDGGFINVTAGDHGLSSAGASWSFNGLVDVIGNSTRKISIADQDPWTKIATATITWQQSLSRSGSIEIATRLKNWRSAGWRLPARQSGVNNSGSQDGTKITVQGDFAYAVLNNSTPDFVIYDISNPQSPAVTGSLSLPDIPMHIAVSGNYAYIASQSDTAELQIIDISNPTAPVQVGSFNAAGTANAIGIYAVGTTVYLVRDTSTSDELIIVNANNPNSPSLLGSLNLNAGANEIVVIGDYAYIASDSNTQEVQVVNIANPSSLAINGSVNLAGTTDALAITGAGDVLFVGQGAQLRAFTITDPAVPVEQVAFNSGGTINDIAYDPIERYVFLATSAANPEFRVLDANTSGQLLNVGSLNLGGIARGIAYDALRDRALLMTAINNEELTLITPEE